MLEMNPTINGTCRCSLLSAIDLLDSPLTLALFFFAFIFWHFILLDVESTRRERLLQARVPFLKQSFQHRLVH